MHNSTWSYDGDSLSAVVTCRDVSTAAEFTVAITTTATGVTPGMVGAIKRANAAKLVLDVTRQTLGAHKPIGGMLKSAASTGEALSYLAGKSAADFATTVAAFPALYKAAVAEVMGMKAASAGGAQVAAVRTVDPTRLAYAQALVEHGM
jgi:hypothetical protein